MMVMYVELNISYIFFDTLTPSTSTCKPTNQQSFRIPRQIRMEWGNARVRRVDSVLALKTDGGIGKGKKEAVFSTVSTVCSAHPILSVLI